MNANNLALILCILSPLSLLLVSSLAYSRLKLTSIRASKSLWTIFSIRALVVFLLFEMNLFYLYPLTWIYPLYFIRIYPQESKWWGLSIMCGIFSLFMPNLMLAVGLNILPLTIGPMYLKKRSNSGFVDSTYYNLCLGIYLLIYSSLFWIPGNLIWFGASLEVLWGIVFSVFIALKFMQDRELEHDISMDKVRRDEGEMLMNHSHLSEVGLVCRGMIHEVASPLTVLSAKIHLLKRHGAGEDLDIQLETMDRSVYRMKKIIDGMRLFYQKDANAYEDFQLNDILGNVLLFCGQRFQNYGVSIRTYGLENIIIHSKRFQLEQALLQLMNNAFDAIEYLPQKWIEISARKDDGKIEIFIKDSGDGIPDGIVKDMMSPFYSTKSQDKALGTGLAMAHGIVQRIGGNLSYIRSPHTLFKIELPIKNH